MSVLKLSAVGTLMLALLASAVHADSGQKPLPIVKVKSPTSRPSAWKTWQNKTRSLFTLERTHFTDYIRGNGSPEY